jgi:hypothetical protein
MAKTAEIRKEKWQSIITLRHEGQSIITLRYEGQAIITLRYEGQAIITLRHEGQAIITLRHEGQSIWNISRTLKYSLSAVTKTIKHYDETGSHEDHHRKGRPRVISAAEDRFIS